MKRIAIALALIASFGLAQAQSGMKGMDMKDDHKGMKGMDMKDDHKGMKGMDKKKDKAAGGTVHKASGKVTKVDKDKGMVTIAHGPVASMNWPAMTMAFKAKDKAMLSKLKNGDQVEFSFTQSGKDHVVTEIK